MKHLVIHFTEIDMLSTVFYSIFCLATNPPERVVFVG